jgi:hypothetical protein
MDKSTVGCLAGAHRAAPAAAVLPDVSWYIIPKLEKTYQMNTKCSKWSQNILNVRKEFKMAKNIERFSNLRPSKIYPNWYFWFENKPSGNSEQQRDTNI